MTPCTYSITSAKYYQPLQRNVCSTYPIMTHWLKVECMSTTPVRDRTHCVSIHTMWFLRPVCFVFERARAPGHFPDGKVHSRRILSILNADHFKGTKTMTRGNGGNCLCCLPEVSGQTCFQLYKLVFKIFDHSKWIYSQSENWPIISWQ